MSDSFECANCGCDFEVNLPSVDQSEMPYFTHRTDDGTNYICSPNCMEEYLSSPPVRRWEIRQRVETLTYDIRQIRNSDIYFDEDELDRLEDELEETLQQLDNLRGLPQELQIPKLIELDMKTQGISGV